MAHRKGRSLLTGAGIVLGVAILFGVLVSNATTKKGIDLLMEDFTGRADVVVSPAGFFNAELPPGTLAKVEKLPDVVDVVEEIGFGTSLPEFPSPDDPDEPTGIYVAGIVPSDAQRIQNFTFADGRFANPGADEIVMSQRLADELDLQMGDVLKIRGEAATRDLAIVGLLDNTGAGRAGEGRSTFTSVASHQRLSGDTPGTHDTGSVILADGSDVDLWIATHHDAVKGARLQNAESLADGFKDFVTSFGTMLTFFAGITLFVGSFLIYLTLSMAVIERTRMYGTLRALGATSKQVRRIVLLEGAVLGFVSSLVGLVVGLGLAVGLLKLTSSVFELEVPGLEVTPVAIVVAVVVGLVVTLGSALVPARRASRLSPVEAMKGDFLRDTKLGRAWIAGLVIFVLSIVLTFVTMGLDSEAPPMFVVGILLGTVLMVPLLLRPLATLLGKVTNRLARGVGDIAVLHLSKERSRSAYTLALVMVVMAMVFAIGGLFLSIRGSVDELTQRQFGADIGLFTEVPQKGSLEPKLRGIPDVADVTPLRFGEATRLSQSKRADGTLRREERESLFVRTIEPDSYFRVSSYAWKDGSDADALAALKQGKSILVSSELANINELGVGDTMTLETTTGQEAFRIAAIYSPQFGPPEITMGIADAKRYLGADDPQGYMIDIKDGVEIDTAIDNIEAAFGDTPLDIETAAEVREEARSSVSSYFQVIYAILGVAALVGLLGLANTLAMSVLHRFREIGILRAIGVTRSQTWRMVLVESLTMGLTAFVLALPLGWLLTFLVLKATSQGFGFTVDAVYPWLWIPFVAVFGIVMAIVAAIAPGRRAARLHVVNALQYE